MSTLLNKAIVLGLVTVLSAPVAFAADSAPTTTRTTIPKEATAVTEKAAASTEKKARKAAKKAKHAKKKARKVRTAKAAK